MRGIKAQAKQSIQERKREVVHLRCSHRITIEGSLMRKNPWSTTNNNPCTMPTNFCISTVELFKIHQSSVVEFGPTSLQSFSHLVLCTAHNFRLELAFEPQQQYQNETKGYHHRHSSSSGGIIGFFPANQEEEEAISSPRQASKVLRPRVGNI